MNEPEIQRPRRQWLGLVLTTLLGIAATVVVGWYQLSQAERQAILAETERARAVRETLVSIVEDNVLNDKRIDIPRLTRLIDQRRRDQRVSIPVTVAELLEQAEFNILSSRYLAFERKQALNAVFDALYSDLSTREFSPISPDAPNADLFNTLARQIQDGKTSDALQSIKRLEEAHVKDLQQTRSGRPSPSFLQVLRELLSDPLRLVLGLGLYIVVVIFLFRFRPDLMGVWRRALGLSMSQSDAEERIVHYVEMGMEDEVIVDRLQRFGVPRTWTIKKISTARGKQSPPAA